MLMFVTTEWTTKGFIPTVFCYAMFYGGFGQFVAGVLEVGSCHSDAPRVFTLGWRACRLL